MADPGCDRIGTASLLADIGHEVPTALLPSLLTATFRAPAAALGAIEGVADALAGAARFAGGALPGVHRSQTSVKAGRTAVDADPARVNPDTIIAAVTAAGYRARLDPR